MSLLPQPPPDRPSPGQDTIRSRANFWWIGLLGFVAIVLLTFLSAPRLFRSSKKPVDRTEALNNLRQIGVALVEFENEYGSYPSAATIPTVRAATSTPLSLGDGSSNQLFRQLIATGLKSEKPFYAKGPATRKPDDRFDAGHALEPGECGFAYVTGLKGTDDPRTPVVMAPMIRGTYLFDQKALQEKAVVLRLDGSVSPMTIISSGQVRDGAMDLFDSRQSYWKGKKPDLRWQE